MPETTDKLHANLLAELCAAYGVRKAVISPGSRNAPLTMAFHFQADIDCYIIPDERSAAYFAIGIAQYIGQPVAMICTSGTAALNYTPAIAEAYYQELPLIAITADRPPEWVDQLDGQTIRQTNIYDNFTVYQAQLPAEVVSENDVWYVKRLVRDGFKLLTAVKRPIHFNVPFREPLYNKKENIKLLLNPDVFDIGVDQKADISLKTFAELDRYANILLIIGMRRPNKDFSRLVNQLASNHNVVVLCENLSNVSGDEVFLASDAFLSFVQADHTANFVPDLVISFGDILLSKPLKQWIRSLNNIKHWLISQSETAPDVFQHIDRIIGVVPEVFLNKLLNHSRKETIYKSRWRQAFQTFEKLHTDYMTSLPWCDTQVFSVLSQYIPENSIVHLGNSSPVRYAQLFRWRKDIKFFSNRGTAGIDGVTSTALGMASQTKEAITLITGDVSFLYDSNALWNQYKSRNFKIIVINNKGGNIFSLIDGPESTGLLDDYFVTHVPVSIERLCQAYGIGYYHAENNDDLKSVLDQFYKHTTCALLELQTDPKINTRVWMDYFRTIKSHSKHEYTTVENNSDVQ